MTEQLHYYCSSGIFLSILRRRELWLTALDLSNDHLEGRWAIQQYLRLFKKPEDRLRRAGARQDIERALSERLVLGMCFSEKRDLLSQWRGYGSNGRGVCLTFRTEALREAIRVAEDDVPGLKLSKVSYEDIGCSGLPGILYDAFRQGIEGFSMGKDGIGRLHRDFTPEQREKETKAISALFEHKNPAFSEEAEWRLFVVQFPHRLKNLDYREARSLLSPYLRLTLDLSAIETVTVGPCHPTPLKGIEDLMKKFACRARVLTSGSSYLER